MPVRAPRWASRLAVAAAVAAVPVSGCGGKTIFGGYEGELADASKRYTKEAVPTLGELRGARSDRARLGALRKLVRLTDRYVVRLDGMEPSANATEAHADLRQAYDDLARLGRRAIRAVGEGQGTRSIGALRDDPAVLGGVSRAQDAERRLRDAGYELESPLS